MLTAEKAMAKLTYLYCSEVLSTFCI